MNSPASAEEQKPWLSQGDIFKKLPFPRAGVSDSVAKTAVDTTPALLVSHDCAIDKKHNQTGELVLEYLSFLPLQSVAALPEPRRAVVRSFEGKHTPYNTFYLGEVPGVGESYAMLNQPFTLPALLLRVELKDFTTEETGEGDDRRTVATMWNTRVARLTQPALELFRLKWNAEWTRLTPPPE